MLVLWSCSDAILIADISSLTWERGTLRQFYNYWSQLTLIPGHPKCHHDFLVSIRAQVGQVTSKVLSLSLSKSAHQGPWTSGHYPVPEYKIRIDILYIWHNKHFGFLDCRVRVIMVGKAKSRQFNFFLCLVLAFLLSFRQWYADKC